MNDTLQKPGWFKRFSMRGGLTFSLAILAAPFVFHLFHGRWGMDWISTVVLGGLVSIAVGHLLLVLCLFFPFALWATFFSRGRCPHCQKKGLRGALCTSNPKLTGDTQRFFFSECRYCHHQFWTFEGDQAVIHITPTDERYRRA